MITHRLAAQVFLQEIFSTKLFFLPLHLITLSIEYLKVNIFRNFAVKIKNFVM